MTKPDAHLDVDMADGRPCARAQLCLAPELAQPGQARQLIRLLIKVNTPAALPAAVRWL